MADQEKKRPVWLYIGFGIFGITFLAGAVLVGKTLYERSTSKNVYAEIQEEVRKQHFTDSLAAADETKDTETPAQTGAQTAAASKTPSGSEQTPGAAEQPTESAAAPAAETAPTEPPAKPVISMDFKPLQELAPDIVAWIFCEGTAIDYPLVHTDNNDYYINHMYNGEGNGSGAIFLDYRNTGLFTDRNTVVYGHHMKNGTMFQVLVEYKFQGFYDARPEMMLYTPNGDYRIELFAGVVEDGSREFYKMEFADDDEFLDYIRDLQTRSTFVSNVEVKPDDRIVTLCTCSYEFSNARYAVYGRLVPILEEE